VRVPGSVIFGDLHYPGFSVRFKSHLKMTLATRWNDDWLKRDPFWTDHWNDRFTKDWDDWPTSWPAPRDVVSRVSIYLNSKLLLVHLCNKIYGSGGHKNFQIFDPRKEHLKTSIGGAPQKATFCFVASQDDQE
jgi:hypothetical protein